MATSLETIEKQAVADEAPFDVERIRREFPILEMERNGKPIVYLDNAATSQKPHRVLCALDQYYRRQNANVHRGVHYLSEVATDAYERARKKIERFLNAPLTCEIIFTRGTTEAINLVAQSYGRTFIGEGDEIVVSHLEHHSNIVPWQILCEQTGAKLRVAPINHDGEIILEEYQKLLSPRTKLVALSHISNALGTINPVRSMIDMAHGYGAPVLLDGAQSAPHVPIDVQELNCDFYACSGHKMCGPTGIGVLYGKAEHLEKMGPYQGGGDMIMSVTFEKTTYNTLPYKFEAGTPNIAGAIGLGAAVEFLSSVGMDRIAAYEDELLAYGTRLLEAIDGVRIIGTAKEKAGVLSFVMENAHPHDIGQILDDDGVAIRAGHHCAQPVMDFYGVPATTRASLAFYNTKQELEVLAQGLRNVKDIFD
jgi:cysteine desulfurase/selenocysteine lyase